MNSEIFEYGEERFENIVFVDIDGVFNHIKTECDYEFLPESVMALNELYETHQIKLVLSSSWKNAYSFLFMQKLFQYNGIKAPLIDKTCTYFHSIENNNCCTLEELENEETDVRYSREYEIYYWIKIFKPKHYLIIDDYKMEKFNLEEHQILTSYFGEKVTDMAFRKKHLDECRRILSL